MQSKLAGIPFRRYQTEALNLESLSLWSLAISRRAKVFNLGPDSTMENRQMLFLRTIAGSILSSIRNVNYKFPNLSVVVLGNHYQLKNLEPTLIEFIKGKVSFFVIGKTSILHQSMLREKIFRFSLLNPERQHGISSNFYGFGENINPG